MGNGFTTSRAHDSQLTARNLELRTQNPELGTVLRGVAGLHLFQGVLEDDIGSAFLGLLRELAVEEVEPDVAATLGGYGRLFSLLAAAVELRAEHLVGDGWQSHLLDRLLSDANPFSRKAERASIGSIGSSLLEAAGRDLATLQALFRLDGRAVHSLLSARLGDAAVETVCWSDLRPLDLSSNGSSPDAPTIRRRLADADDWATMVEDLAAHYAVAGAGLFARYRAFRWVRRDGVGRLEGVAHPDQVRLEELVEYDVERALLLQNTWQFVDGFPANNALLYGDRGTGKSSTIKALLHRYGDRGLRLVEVPKSLLADFHQILALLRGRRERFILFVDDLSFDERETAYKDLKAALEGSVEARPENVVVYATSNRRHLVQERYSDRSDGDAEIRRQDTHQEKLSLADRFGITLVFSTPDQGRYLRIVESLAGQRGLEVHGAALRSRALEWAAWQGGFSGRTARQFVDHLAGELGAGRVHVG